MRKDALPVLELCRFRPSARFRRVNPSVLRDRIDHLPRPPRHAFPVFRFGSVSCRPDAQRDASHPRDLARVGPPLAVCAARSRGLVDREPPTSEPSAVRLVLAALGRPTVERDEGRRKDRREACRWEGGEREGSEVGRGGRSGPDFLGRYRRRQRRGGENKEASRIA